MTLNQRAKAEDQQGPGFLPRASRHARLCVPLRRSLAQRGDSRLLALGLDPPADFDVL
jgi:hypothetical protein